jgi:hypothetical protein
MFSTDKPDFMKEIRLAYYMTVSPNKAVVFTNKKWLLQIINPVFLFLFPAK